MFFQEIFYIYLVFNTNRKISPRVSRFLFQIEIQQTDAYSKFWHGFQNETKGQTKSKRFFQADVSSNEGIQFYYYETCFCSFFGRN